MRSMSRPISGPARAIRAPAAVACLGRVSNEPAASQAVKVSEPADGGDSNQVPVAKHGDVGVRQARAFQRLVRVLTQARRTAAEAKVWGLPVASNRARVAQIAVQFWVVDGCKAATRRKMRILEVILRATNR